MIDLAKTIEPKSDQLNADDLVAGPLTVTVTEVKRGPNNDQPVDIELDRHRPYRSCKSMRRVLIAAWGDKGADWVGRSMTLYADPTVKFGGVAVGGIRISHLSDINSDLSLMLTVTRSRRSEYRVKMLTQVPDDYPQADFEKNKTAWANAIIAGKITFPELVQKTASKGKLTAKQIDELTEMTEANNGK